MALHELLHECSTFSEFSMDDLKILATFMEEVNIKHSELIFDEQSPSNAVYIILSGRVSIYKMFHGMANFLTILEKNDIFGEVAFVDNKTRSASAKTLDDCRLAKFGYSHFDIIRKQAPEIGMKFTLVLMKELSRKFRAINSGIDLKSLEHTLNEIIISRQEVKLNTPEVEYYCHITYFDRGVSNPFMKIDVKGQIFLIPFSQIRSIVLPNSYGKF
ncbi:MAG: cyclic nucleotide-binding domain-containing protein [Candidatus Ozemobacteraceae bacterium]